jgi:hypothetical protein
VLTAQAYRGGVAGAMCAARMAMLQRVAPLSSELCDHDHCDSLRRRNDAWTATHPVVERYPLSPFTAPVVDDLSESLPFTVTAHCGNLAPEGAPSPPDRKQRCGADVGSRFCPTGSSRCAYGALASGRGLR